MRAPLAGLLAVVFPCLALFAGEAPVPAAPAANTANDAAVTALREKLEKSVMLDMPGIPLARALEVLAQRAGVYLRVQDKDRPNLQQDVRFSADSVRPIDLLDVLSQLHGIVYEITPRGVMVYQANDPSRRKAVFRAYNVNDLTSDVLDAGDLEAEHAPQGVSPQFTIAATTAPTLTNIADMFRNRVSPDSWDAALGTSIEERGGLLCVVQTEEVHARIRRMLASFRQKQTRQVAVNVRVLSARSVDIDRLRAETGARGISAPVMDDAAQTALDALVRDGSATQLFAGNSIVFNTQRGALQNIKSAPYVAGVEVSGDAYDPTVRQLNIGTIVRARPMLSDDGQYITLSLDATHSELRGVEDVVFQRGGQVRNNSGNNSTITIKRSERKMKAGDDETKTPDKEDVTNEFDISRDEPRGGTLALTGPMQIQMATRSYSRVAQDLLLRPGQSAAVSAPMHGPNGIDLGREMLVLVRCQPLSEPEIKETDEAVKPDITGEAVTQALAKPVTLNFLETPFHKAIDAWMQAAKVPVLMNVPPAVLSKPITLTATGISAREAFDQILQQTESAFRPFNSLLLVGTADALLWRNVRMRVIDIRDMTTTFTDHPGEGLGLPKINPGNYGNAFAMAPDADYVTSGLGAADFASILRERLFPGYFSSPVTSIEESGGKLIVMNTPEVLEKIHTALHDMRHTGRAPIVLTTRWAIVNTDELETAFGKNATALLDPAQAAKAFTLIGQAGARDLQASRILGFNGQRLSSFGGLTRGFIQDYDISGDLPCPVIAQMSSGGVTDLTARIMEGTDPGTPGQLLIDTRLVLARSDSKVKSWDMLAVPNTKPVTAFPAAFGKFEQPSVDTERIFTTVRIANNGAALFRLPVPAWVEGEEPEARRTGKRTMIVLLHAVQQKF